MCQVVRFVDVDSALGRKDPGSEDTVPKEKVLDTLVYGTKEGPEHPLTPRYFSQNKNTRVYHTLIINAPISRPVMQ